VGQKINLPDIKESASSAVSSGTGSTPAGDTYKVQAGDSLQKIARKLYGDPARWEDIYKANRAAIGPDPSRIRAGMVLKVPAR